MYRVFLQDEKDAPSPLENPSNTFRIRSGEILAWTYTTGNYTPSLESQLSATDFGSRVSAFGMPLDGHFLIKHDSLPLGIVHTLEEIPDRAYEFARTQAVKLSEHLSRKKGNQYVFIDLTSRGDKELAEKLSRIIHNKEIYVASPRVVDIED